MNAGPCGPLGCPFFLWLVSYLPPCALSFRVNPHFGSYSKVPPVCMEAMTMLETTMWYSIRPLMNSLSREMISSLFNASGICKSLLTHLPTFNL